MIIHQLVHKRRCNAASIVAGFILISKLWCLPFLDMGWWSVFLTVYGGHWLQSTLVIDFDSLGSLTFDLHATSVTKVQYNGHDDSPK